MRLIVPAEDTDQRFRTAIRTSPGGTRPRTAYRPLMHPGERDQETVAAATGSTDEAPALRDATETASRIEADEAAALEAEMASPPLLCPPFRPMGLSGRTAWMASWYTTCVPVRS